MRAVVCTAYGDPDVLQMRDLARPSPRAGEVLVRVAATTAHVGDARIRRADPFAARFAFGLLHPRRDLVLGMELSGTVAAVGDGAAGFTVGDDVMAFCGFRLGAYAEFRALPVTARDSAKHGVLAHKPASLSFAEAAALPAGGLTALKNLQKAGLRQGQRVLINGASGSLGTFAVQLAKLLGAEVTAVCSGANRELVLGLGADEVIDYTREDVARRPARFDVVYDAVMSLPGGARRRLVHPGGVVVRNSGLGRITESDLRMLGRLADEGVLRPVIDSVHPLENAMDAHRRVDTGRKRGNVVLAVSAA